MKINFNYILFKIFQISTIYVFLAKLIFPLILLIGMIFMPHTSPINKLLLEIAKYTTLTIILFILTGYFEIKYKMNKEKGE